MDSSKTSNYQKINNLKNKISENFKENQSVAFINNLHNTDPTNWLSSKEATIYGLELATKVKIFSNFYYNSGVFFCSF